MTFTQPQLHLPRWADHSRWESHQRGIFDDICRQFDDGHNLVLADVPCGGGKSLLGYMVHQYLGGRTLTLVGTKSLQDQYERDLPIALVKGKSNYTPLYVTRSSWKDPDCSDCDYDFATDLCSFCEDRRHDCPYVVARDMAADSDYTCTNMAYALGEWSGARSRFRGRDLVILDEADTAADEIMGHVSVSISPNMQQRLGLSPPEKKTVESSWAAWFDYSVPYVERVLTRLPTRSLQDKRLIQRTSRLLGKLRAVASNLDGWVYEYARDYIEFKPVTVDHLAGDALWSHGKRWLAMSASLGAPEAFVSDLGWQESYGYVGAASTFDKAKRPVYLAPSAFMTKKQEATSWPEMAIATQASVEMYPDKNILVHSHSYGLTRSLSEHFADYDRPVFHYLNADTRQSAVAEFESTPGSILIAPSMDRGYDNSDIDVGILCKVPSPYLGSKQVNKRLRETKDGQLWYANTTARSVTQAYGRIMRSESDSGIFIILDSMFAKFYGQWKWLFPTWFQEAYHPDSDLRFDLRIAIRQLKLSSS